MYCFCKARGYTGCFNSIWCTLKSQSRCIWGIQVSPVPQTASYLYYEFGFTQASICAIFLFIWSWLWKVRKMIFCLEQFGLYNTHFGLYNTHFEMISIKFWKKKSELSQFKLKNVFRKSNCLHLDKIEYETKLKYILPPFILKYWIIFRTKNSSPPGGLEPPTFRLTVERASQLRHGGSVESSRV